MDKRLILGVGLAAIGGALVARGFDKPAIAQSFGSVAGGTSVAATAPNAQGVSHAWTVDLRTNTVVMCRGDAAGKVSCTQSLMPGAAQLQR
jgi:hypothetical protein